MYNDSGNKIFLFLKQKKKKHPPLSYREFPKNTNLFLRRVLYLYILYISIFYIIYKRSLFLLFYYYMLNETKKTKWAENLYISMEEITMWKTRQEFSTITLWNNWRDVAQLGSAFVLGTKCHRFKSCHPYLLLLKGAVTRDQLRSLQIGHNLWFLSCYSSICIQNVLGLWKESFCLQSYLFW